MEFGNDEHQLDITTAPVQPAPPHSAGTFAFLRTHPYASALSVTAFAVVIGVFIIVTRAPVQPSSGALAWGGTGSFTSSYAAPVDTSGQPSESIMQQVQGGAPYNYVLPTPQAATVDNTDTTASGDSFDFNSFISLLSNENATTSSSQTTSTTNAYAFIPTGLVSLETPKKRTATQDSLYNYGNDVGSYIQSFEQQNPNEGQVLWDQAQDRTNPDKIAALTQLAQSLTALGNSLSQMDVGDGTADQGGNENVPSQMKSAHEALAQSYKDLGTKLALVPQAQRDTDFVAAVEAYDTSAQTFTKNYVAVANLFVAYGVTFAPEDPGSIFTFTPATL